MEETSLPNYRLSMAGSQLSLGARELPLILEKGQRFQEWKKAGNLWSGMKIIRVPLMRGGDKIRLFIGGQKITLYYHKCDI